MPDFFALPASEQRAALLYAADQSGSPAYLLEKDIWVVWALQTLFASVHAAHLIFKGGTSLSKAYRIIRRFSEDVDLTYDIRAIAGDLVDSDAENPVPRSRSQEQRWTKEIRGRLSRFIANEIIPELSHALQRGNLPAKLRADEEKIFIEYAPLVPPSAYVRAAVALEFGARSSGQPNESKPIVCDASAYIPGVDFPTAAPQVMLPERTFWEKATAVHVFCAQGRFRGGERFSRHWHDLTRLDRAQIVDRAVADRTLAQAVADHKAAFFLEKDPAGRRIDYQAAVSGKLCLVPDGPSLKSLEADYHHMVEDGLLREDAEPFRQLLVECKHIQDKTNDRMKPERS